jgi:hypothetical protein
MVMGDRGILIIVLVWHKDIFNNPWLVIPMCLIVESGVVNNPWLVIPHVSAVVVANMLEYLPNMVVFETERKVLQRVKS